MIFLFIVYHDNLRVIGMMDKNLVKNRLKYCYLKN